MRPKLPPSKPGRRTLQPLGLFKTLPLMLAGLGVAFVCPQTSAMGLGSATTSSRIGGPLRVEIPILAEDADRIEPSCIRLANAPAGYAEEIPWLSKARINLEKQGNRRLLVVSSPNNNDPAFMLGIHIGCGVEIRRDYTLLLDPPFGERATPLLETPPPRSQPETLLVPTETARKGNTILTRTGDTARSIANKLYPGDVSAQRRMARALLAHNATLLQNRRGTYDSLPGGIEIAIPPLPATLEAQAQTPAPPPRAQSGTNDAPQSVRANPASRSTAEKGRDRLFVSAPGSEEPLQLSSSIGPRKELNEDQRARLRTEQQLITSLDEKISTQLELADRLRQLEALQARLKEDADRLEAELRAQQSAPLALSQSATISKEQAPLAPTASSSTKDANSPLPWHQNHFFLASLVLGLLLPLSAALFVLRRRRAERERAAQHDLNTEADASIGEQLIDPLSEADIWPDEKGRAPQSNRQLNASMDGALGALTASGLGPASMLQILDDDVEEHDSAVELADIMMSFGRIQGAAETLADFIRANPRQAVKPWIKLLEVYRAADMRVEYEALSAQLTKTFNVRSVAWDDFEIARQAPESLEDMPHIVSRLIEKWGRRECQAFLHELLRDNRQGTRQGFPLAIIDEILLLLGILESQIGPYRPPTTEPTVAAQTRTRAPSLPIATLKVPPIITEPTTQPIEPAIESAKPEPNPTSSINSLSQLDFELDMTDLSKTLHLNLDDLESTRTQNNQPST